jgi:hypothetical protein
MATLAHLYELDPRTVALRQVGARIDGILDGALRTAQAHAMRRAACAVGARAVEALDRGEAAQAEVGTFLRILRELHPSMR